MTEQEEIASLDRVLTRLALTDEGSLQKVLDKLLPLVINKLQANHPALRQKVLEILTHVNKRIKGQGSMQLPLKSLLELYSGAASGMVKNFTIVYIEMAMERCPLEGRELLVAHLLGGIAKQSMQHQEMLLRMAVTAMEPYATPRNAHQMGTEAEFAAKHPFLQDQQDRKVFLRFSLKLLLYQPPASLVRPSAVNRIGRMNSAFPASRSEVVQGAQRILGQAGAGADAAEPVPLPTPPGLTPTDVKLIEGKTAPSGETVLARKLGVLNFIGAAGLPPGECLLLYVAAASNPQDAVARRGEELQKKQCPYDTTKPAVDLEDAGLISSLMEAFLGTTDNATAVPPPRRVRPANAAMKGRLMSIFTRSVSASNAFPVTLQVIQECIYGSGASTRLRQQGMEFCSLDLQARLKRSICNHGCPNPPSPPGSA
ncbi:hypothetical protein WJX84_005457 [Apatococcus fuscideae]|uniref:Proteasome component Ecm29 N-terminal domain-containing protein n=1 Tax=Apatococcus fuscideae TaxID=2026836 RepID=A0AAW1T4Z4_9CHLO